jgi:transcriptional regulator with XRE-family HTH domain
MQLKPKQVAALRRAPEGNRLRAARRLAQLTQVDVSAAVGFPQPQISRDEAGDASGMPLAKARAYADFFGVHIEDLFPAKEAVA